MNAELEKFFKTIKSEGWTKAVYAYNDFSELQAVKALQSSYTASIRSIDELLERDNQREKDGFPRKIRVGRLIKPGKGGKGKIVVVPTTVEEKFIHDNVKESAQEDGQSGGSGDGEEGEVIGEQPIHAPDTDGGAGPGQGEGDQHDLESSAYDLGKILTEKFELPNLKDKGKKADNALNLFQSSPLTVFTHKSRIYG